MSKNKLFKLNRSLHRDIGYLSIGFTIIFAISGLALNHRDDWNPNYTMTREIKEVSTPPTNTQELISLGEKTFSIQKTPKGSFWTGPNELKVFYPNETTVIYLKDKKVFIYESLKPRFLLRAFNGLHLNELKSYWVVASDIYSIFLFYLAISALFMVKGKYGIKGRGGVLTAIGLIIPAFFIYQIVSA